MLHNRVEWRPVLIELVLVLLDEAEQGRTPCQNPNIIPGEKRIGNICEDLRPLIRIVPLAHSDNAPFILFLKSSILVQEHLIDNVQAQVALVLFLDYYIAEAGDCDALGLLFVYKFPVSVHKLAKLHGCSQTKVEIGCRV